MNLDDYPETLQRAFESLRMAGPEPPPAAWDYLVDADDDAATRGLLELAREGGQSAIHAVRILGERDDADAIGPMVELLVEGDLEKLMRDELTFAFHEFGEEAVDELMEAYEEAAREERTEAMSTVVEAVLETGVRNRRVSELLAAHVEREPAVVRRMLANYERVDEVVEVLEERAEEWAELDQAARPDAETVRAVWNTIKQLGGEVPDALRRDMRPTPQDRPDNAAESYIKRDAGSSD